MLLSASFMIELNDKIVECLSSSRIKFEIQTGSTSNRKFDRI